MQVYDLGGDEGGGDAAGAASLRGGGWTGRPRGVASCRHGDLAREVVIEQGLLPEEVEEVLGGRSMTSAFPPLRGERAEDYAARTFSDLMVAYLAFENRPMELRG